MHGKMDSICFIHSGKQKKIADDVIPYISPLIDHK